MDRIRNFPCRTVAAQGRDEDGEKNVNQLSKELVNPIGPNWLINTYLHVNKKDGNVTDKSHQLKVTRGGAMIEGAGFTITPVLKNPFKKSPF